jgi:hypothetical protein
MEAARVSKRFVSGVKYFFGSATTISPDPEIIVADHPSAPIRGARRTFAVSSRQVQQHFRRAHPIWNVRHCRSRHGWSPRHAQPRRASDPLQPAVVEAPLRSRRHMGPR